MPYSPLAGPADSRYDARTSEFADYVYMVNRDMTRWNLSIPEETDRLVRTFLARNGRKRGDLSRFVDEAVRRRVQDLTVEQVKDRNAAHDQQAIFDLLDDEVAAGRAGRS